MCADNAAKYAHLPDHQFWPYPIKIDECWSVLPTQFYFDHARPALETLSERVVSNAGHPAVNDVDDTETPLTCIVSDATDAKTAIGTQKYS